MTTDRDKCGLGSLLPMSCRGRAEAFARRLHSRLTSLGSQDGTNGADESSWLAAHETTSLALSQPRHTSTTEGDLLFDLETLESPGSPEDDIDRTSELEKLINKDNLKVDRLCPKQKNDPKNRIKSTNSNDSDSDGPFYDVETEEEKINLNGLLVNGVNYALNGSLESTETDDSESKDYISQDLTNHTDDNYETISALSDENSTLSLKDDDDFYSLELANGFVSEPCKCDEITQTSPEEEKLKTVVVNNDDKETYTSSLSVDKDMTVECPNNSGVEISIHPLLEIDSPRSSKINSALEDDDDDDTEIERIPRVRRCSSLKTGKTPPGTPGRKKIVRFADVLGLDLADVRTFLDEIPKVPTSAYEDLKDVDLCESDSESGIMGSVSSHKFHGIKVDKVLVPLFQQPGGQTDFLDKVRERSVCLENALVEDPLALAISGTVRVLNLDFHKSVHIRYSLDSWQTFADVQATYVENSCDGFSDKFSFLMYAHTLTVGQRLEFAARFQCKGRQYWDNNKGANYCFQCLPATNNPPSYTPITGTDDGFGASFY